jgi:peroxiredoxin (alkyl hydroperoxide reductase subunit C)
MTMLQDSEHHCLRLGDKAPNFEATTTQGVVRLADFAGHWLMLFSHPADFTPV